MPRPTADVVELRRIQNSYIDYVAARRGLGQPYELPGIIGLFYYAK